MAQLVKNPPAMQETWVRSLGWEDPLETGKAALSSILTWRIPWTVYSTGSQKVGHDWATFTFTNSQAVDRYGSVACEELGHTAGSEQWDSEQSFTCQAPLLPITHLTTWTIPSLLPLLPEPPSPLSMEKLSSTKPVPSQKGWNCCPVWCHEFCFYY